MSLPPLKSAEDLERFLDENEGLDVEDLVPLPYPYQDWEDEPIPPLTEEQRGRYEIGPDGVSATQRRRLPAACLGGVWGFVPPG